MGHQLTLLLTKGSDMVLELEPEQPPLVAGLPPQSVGL